MFDQDQEEGCEVGSDDTRWLTEKPQLTAQGLTNFTVLVSKDL